MKLTKKGLKLLQDTAGFSASEVNAIKMVNYWLGVTDEMWDIQKPRLTSRKTLKRKGLIS
jgi:hypothetical protein